MRSSNSRHIFQGQSMDEIIEEGNQPAAENLFSNLDMDT